VVGGLPVIGSLGKAAILQRILLVLEEMGGRTLGLGLVSWFFFPCSWSLGLVCSSLVVVPV
jgi:hypothetical protein